MWLRHKRNKYPEANRRRFNSQRPTDMKQVQYVPNMKNTNGQQTYDNTETR